MSDKVATHPAIWSSEYRALVRRALSCRLFENIGAAELFTERLDEWCQQEESGIKTRLWETDLVSQRLVDAQVSA